MSSENESDYFSRWVTYCATRSDIDNLDWVLSPQKKHNTQKNGDANNCGPWCCFYLTQLLSNGSLTSNINIINFRNDILEKILDYGRFQLSLS